MEVRIRLGTRIAQLAPAPILRLDLPSGATVADLLERLALVHPELAPALSSALPVMRGAHAEPGEQLTPGAEVALITPISGG